MALQTKTLAANGAKGHHKFTLTVSENSTSISNNTSSLSFSFVLSPVQTSWNWEQWGSSISYVININGTKYSGSIPAYDGYSSVTLKSGSLSVGHNSDGSKSISVSFSVSDGAGQYYTPGNASSSATMNLTTIPRSSAITSAGNITLGNKCGITFIPANTSFQYNIKFSIGNWSANTGKFTPGITSSYTYNAYTIPSTSDILSQIPSSVTGTMTATLTTYNSSGTQIGSAYSKTFKVTVPSNVVPTVGTITLNPTDINGQNILVQGKNRLTVSVSGCSAGTGSSIKSYTFSGPGISNTTTSTSVISSGTISNTGTLTYTVKVTDNRGRTASKTATIVCYSWVPPTISLDAYRVSSNTSTIEDDNGTYIRCAYNLTYSSVNSTNDVTVRIYYKKNAASSWSVVTSLTNSKDISGSYILSSMDVATTYAIYATVTDNYGGSVSSSKITVLSAERILNIRPNGTGIALGKMADTDNLLDCKWPIKTGGNYVATKPITLFNSSSGGEGGSITLSENVVGYEYLEIYYADESGYVSAGSIRFCSPNNKTIDLTCTGAQTDSGKLYIKTSRYTVIDNKLNFIRSKHVTLTNGAYPTMTESTSTNYLKILRVVGFN